MDRLESTRSEWLSFTARGNAQLRIDSNRELISLRDRSADTGCSSISGLERYGVAHNISKRISVEAVNFGRCVFSCCDFFGVFGIAKQEDLRRVQVDLVSNPSREIEAGDIELVERFVKAIDAIERIRVQACNIARIQLVLALNRVGDTQVRCGADRVVLCHEGPLRGRTGVARLRDENDSLFEAFLIGW